MSKVGKKYQAKLKKVTPAKLYDLAEAVALVKELATAKFDETIDLAVKLGVDPKKTEQAVKGMVVLPNGLGRSVRVLVLAKGDKCKEATDAGADFAGAEELIEKIQQGWIDFEAVIATPDLMGQVGKLGKILGRAGLMPTPKKGTVTMDVAKAVKEFKAGKVEFKIDKFGIIHSPVGKASFDAKKLAENVQTLIDAVVKAKPAGVKGAYLESVTVASTMGPGVPVNAAKL